MVILLILTRLACKQLQIGTDMLLIITSTSDELLNGVSFERPMRLPISGEYNLGPISNRF